jgi:RNA polymerase sigma-70 factor (ECF subfamily)
MSRCVVLHIAWRDSSLGTTAAAHRRDAGARVRRTFDGLLARYRALPFTSSPTRVTDGSAARQQQFHDVALRWLPDVTRFAQSLTRDETQAEDLVQETYLRAWRHWDTFKVGSEARAWLFTIARNAWRKKAPRDARLVAVEDQQLQAMSDAEYPLGASSDVTRALAAVDLGPAIAEAIEGLPEVFRDVVQLADVQELSYAEVAEVLGIPVGTVRSRLFRARRLLQTALLEHAQDHGLVSPPTQQEAT